MTNDLCSGIRGLNAGENSFWSATNFRQLLVGLLYFEFVCYLFHNQLLQLVFKAEISGVVFGRSTSLCCRCSGLKLFPGIAHAECDGSIAVLFEIDHPKIVDKL